MRLLDIVSWEGFLVMSVGIPIFALVMTALNEVLRPNAFSMMGLWHALASHEAVYQYGLFGKSTDAERLAA